MDTLWMLDRSSRLIGSGSAARKQIAQPRG
jgi:hypothetical protein